MTARGDESCLTISDPDVQEMTRLLDSCSRPRLKQELEPWLAKAKPHFQGRDEDDDWTWVRATPEAEPRSMSAELLADCAEMQSLLATCTRERILRELRPWLLDTDRQCNAVAETNSQNEEDVPLLVIAGSCGTGRKRLLRAFAERDVGAEMPAMVCATVDTKYYTAHVSGCVVDSTIALSDAGRTELSLLRRASAIVFIWDVARPDTFASLKRLRDFLEEQDGESADRVQLCVAVATYDGDQLSERCAALVDSDILKKAREWCAETSFEHLHCTLSSVDLESVRKRWRGESSKAGGLLGSDDPAERIVEALESFMWPGLAWKDRSASCNVATDLEVALDKSRSAAEEALQTAPPTPDQEDIPLVVVVGPDSVNAVGLVRALAGCQDCNDLQADTGEQLVSIDTKYYTAQIRLRAANVSAPAAASALRTAHGVILLWDGAVPETLIAIKRLYDTVHPPTETGDVDDADDSEGNDVMRLCIAVGGDASTGSSQNSDDDIFEAETWAWCAQRGIELLRGAFTPAELEAMRVRRVRADGHSLLSGDICDGAARVVEALECHMWPGLELKSKPTGRKATEPTVDRSLGGETAITCDAPIHPEAVTESASDRNGKGSRKDEGDMLEGMDGLSEEIRKVRGLSDDAERRERAAAVAMQMAQFLNLDESDED